MLLLPLQHLDRRNLFAQTTLQLELPLKRDRFRDSVRVKKNNIDKQGISLYLILCQIDNYDSIYYSIKFEFIEIMVYFGSIVNVMLKTKYFRFTNIFILLFDRTLYAGILIHV